MQSKSLIFWILTPNSLTSGEPGISRLGTNLDEVESKIVFLLYEGQIFTLLIPFFNGIFLSPSDSILRNLEFKDGFKSFREKPVLFLSRLFLQISNLVSVQRSSYTPLVL